MTPKIKLQISKDEAMHLLTSLYRVNEWMNLGQKATTYALAPRITRFAFSDPPSSYLSINMNEAEVINASFIRDRHADTQTSRIILNQIQPKLV